VRLPRELLVRRQRDLKRRDKKRKKDLKPNAERRLSATALSRKNSRGSARQSIKRSVDFRSSKNRKQSNDAVRKRR
jgi:hypothetical protein